MKIALVTGSLPPEPCGVGDFTHCLGLALEKKGVQVEFVSGKNWRVSNVTALRREILKYHPDVVHLQYPTFGFGKCLGPQILSVLIPSVITLHETSQVHILRRLSMYAFALRDQRLVFTTEFERQYALQYAPWVKERSLVIPLGTSITPSLRSKQRNDDEIIYFGLIRPGKGLEEVLQLARLIRNRRRRFHIRIIGAVYGNANEYCAQLQSSSQDLEVTWESNLTDEEVGEALSQAAFAYLPYPDGISERRSSMIAALSNRLVVITTEGMQTPVSLRGAVEFAKCAKDALTKIDFLRTNPSARQTLLDKADEYLSHRSWDFIADQHLRLYDEICTRNRNFRSW